MPLVLGCTIYYCTWIPQILKNHLPDGLWSYSLYCTLFIIWDRNINWFWTLFVSFLFILFEFLQYNHLINGTGDILDVITYFLSYFIAWSLNKYFFTITIKQSV